MTDAANQLPAVTSAGAPADFMGFEQDDTHAALSQFQRRVEPGKTTPDHTHVRHPLTLQHRMVGLRQAAGGVIRSGVLAALIRGAHVRNPDYLCLENFTEHKPCQSRGARTAVRCCLGRGISGRLWALFQSREAVDEL